LTTNAAGDITSLLGKTLAYDSAGRLSEATAVPPCPSGTNCAGQQTTLSRFNGWGQRFLRDTPNAQTVFSYGTDGHNLLSETTRNLSTSALSTTEHIWLPTASGPMPVAAVINGVHHAVHADHLNTPRRLSDSAWQTRWQWPYSGFGEINPQSTPAAGQAAVSYSLRYPGQIDDGNGLFYNWHRSYDPRVGRYTSSDPIGLEGGWNRFGYVDADPLGFVDPEGLQRSFGSGNARDRRFDRRHKPARPPSHTPSDSWQDAAGYFDEDGEFVCLRWRCTNNGFDPNCSVPTFDNITKSRRYSEFIPNATNPKEPPMGCTCDTPAWRDSKSPGNWELEDWADFVQKAHKRSKAR
jgi:RHS repeat-associated protein